MMCVGDRTPFCLPVGVRWRGQHYGCAPAPLLVSVITFSFLPPRPLASTVNDKLELQECLEHGRIAKVSPAPEPSAGGAGAGLGVGGAEQPPRLCPTHPLGLWVCLAWGMRWLGGHVGHSHSWLQERIQRKEGQEVRERDQKSLLPWLV